MGILSATCNVIFLWAKAKVNHITSVYCLLIKGSYFATQIEYPSVTQLSICIYLLFVKWKLFCPLSASIDLLFLKRRILCRLSGSTHTAIARALRFCCFEYRGNATPCYSRMDRPIVEKKEVILPAICIYLLFVKRNFKVLCLSTYCL